MQWVPLYAEAFFDLKNDSHNLQLTVWGNVTGARTTGELPPADDPYWKDPNKTNGKIVQIPEQGFETATTLIRKVEFLSYRPFYDNADFCDKGLVNGSCPLPPVFGEVQYR
jgi:hypothetical protein